MAKHYTGILQIMESDEYLPQDNVGGGYRRHQANETRHVTSKEVKEVAKIVVRASNFTELKRRLEAHVAILEDPNVAVEFKAAVQ